MKNERVTAAGAVRFPLAAGARHLGKSCRSRTTIEVSSDEEWPAIEETLYLYGIPGMVDSILEQAAIPIERWTAAPGW